MVIAPASLHGARALRAAALGLPSVPASSCHPSQCQHRLFSLRAPASQALVARQPRPRRPPASDCRPCCRQRPLVHVCVNTASARRGFHVAALANATVDAAEATIAQLHTISHTPWFLTLPLVALGVNLVFRLPFSLHARTLAQKRARLAPLLQAWAVVHSKGLFREQQKQAREQRLPDAVSSKTAIQAGVIKHYKKTESRIYRAFGVPRWKLYGNLLALPPWLVVIEAIRRMCGAPLGLLSLLVGNRSATVAATTAAAEATDATAASAAVADNVDVASIASASSASAVTDSVSGQLDPTLATGGCLWFPDLTVADPYHILPFALSAMLVINVLPSTDAGRRAIFGLSTHSDGASEASINTRSLLLQAGTALQRTLLILSLVVGPLTLHFPAAIHLYWLSSAAITLAISRAIGLFRPIPQTRVKPSNSQDMPWIRSRAVSSIKKHHSE